MLILDAHSSPKKSQKCSQFYSALKAKKKMSLSWQQSIQEKAEKERVDYFVQIL